MSQVFLILCSPTTHVAIAAEAAKVADVTKIADVGELHAWYTCICH